MKSCNSLKTHSRKSSESLPTASASGGSSDNDAASRRETPTDGEVDVWKRWGHIVADWDNYWKKHKDVIKELVKQGIPHHFR